MKKAAKAMAEQKPRVSRYMSLGWVRGAPVTRVGHGGRRLVRERSKLDRNLLYSSS